jgi:superoxide reductase
LIYGGNKMEKTNLREIYKCEICGNVIEVVHEGAVALVCCGEPMKKMVAKTEDSAKKNTFLM